MAKYQDLRTVGPKVLREERVENLGPYPVYFVRPGKAALADMLVCFGYSAIQQKLVSGYVYPLVSLQDIFPRLMSLDNDPLSADPQLQLSLQCTEFAPKIEHGTDKLYWIARIKTGGNGYTNAEFSLPQRNILYMSPGFNGKPDGCPKIVQKFIFSWAGCNPGSCLVLYSNKSRTDGVSRKIWSAFLCSYIFDCECCALHKQTVIRPMTLSSLV